MSVVSPGRARIDERQSVRASYSEQASDAYTVTRVGVHST
jgi:hypothetical protein